MNAKLDVRLDGRTCQAECFRNLRLLSNAACYKQSKAHNSERHQVHQICLIPCSRRSVDFVRSRTHTDANTHKKAAPTTKKSKECSLRSVPNLLLQSPAIRGICIALIPQPLLLCFRSLCIVLLLCDPDCGRQHAYSDSHATKLRHLLGFSDLDRSFSWFTKPSKSFWRCSLFASAFFCSSGL